jgi:hypothetical protein
MLGFACCGGKMDAMAMQSFGSCSGFVSSEEEEAE